jgi:choline dehydrogenase-like flavoprotein
LFYVIGSGPSGIAAARALLDAGRPVTMLDVGETCDPAALDRARRLAATPRELWSESDVATVRGPSYFADPDQPIKRAFGSTFAYALDEMRHDSQDGTRCVQSFARGGLSNVWGAAVLPSRAADLRDWPFGLGELEAGYAAVARWMPIAGDADDLAADFPFYGPRLPALRPSRQAMAQLEKLSAHRDQLREAGVTFGASRLAVRSLGGANGAACQYTGLCLTGCPHFAIWSADQALEDLSRHPDFTYRGGFRVEALHASGTHGPTIAGTGPQAHHESLPATRVLVACGPLATARIVLHSLARYDQALTLCYQPYFLLPMLAASGTPEVETEALHTLSQLFVEIASPAISPFTVHLQLYTFNTLVEERLRAMLWPLGPLGAVTRRRLAGRLVAVQGYLHSSHAEGITLKARRDADGGRVRLELRANSAPAEIVNGVVRLLRRHRRWLGATPLSFMLQIGRPGDGNHCGGSFPMRETPGPLETDALGQLRELPGVHLVDSSVLPSLPSTTFTYTVMANAHRIARAVADLEAA